jgi:LemA protein
MGILTDMSGSIYLWLGIAVLVFWCVGVYNRLMRMRARGFAAFGSLEKHLKTFDTLLQTYAFAPDDGGASPTQSGVLPGEWAVLLERVTALELAGKAARAAPLRPEPSTAMGQAIDAVLQEWQLISSEPADLAGSPVPDSMRIQWEDASTRAQAARAALNQIVLRYNESLREFPARLIVGILGFKPAGTL